MPRLSAPPCAAVILALALTSAGPTTVAAAEPPAGYAPVAVTNTTERVVFCTLLFDGRARTELAIRPGKTWSEAFAPGRDLLLVCQRSKPKFFGPLAPGQSYSIVQAGSKVDIADGAGG